MLHEFLFENQKEILALTEKKTRELAGFGPSSQQLEQGLPIFYGQLMNVLRLEQHIYPHVPLDKCRMAKAALNGDEPGLVAASGRPHEVEVAKTAGLHGSELMRLGYTLSHVVHAYGAMCQSINECAIAKDYVIAPEEFRRLNQCLDVAIAGAVTEFQSEENIKKSKREVEQLGFLAHELRNALATATMAFQLIKEGVVAPRGSTGQMLERSLLRLDELIARSLTEVRLRGNPKLHVETFRLLQLVDQIGLIARVEATSRNLSLEIQIDPAIELKADPQLVHSALSNLIQNSLKFTRNDGKIQVRASQDAENTIVEVEDECGGLSPDAELSLFKAFEQHAENRKGLGLGLAIAQQAIALNHGIIECHNLPGKGCIFKIILPDMGLKASGAA